MRYIEDTLNFETEHPGVITLGKFDGLHRGHMLLVNRILELGKKERLETVVFTFSVPPASRVSHQPARQLLTNSERQLRLKSLGVDTLVECPFNETVMHMEAEAFVEEILVKKLHAACVVVGSDFCFGYRRRGNAAMLQKMGPSFGFRTEIVPKASENGREISSTWIREELDRGNMEKAAGLLGCPYTVREKIVHGRALGRTIGIPTINQIPAAEKLLPPYGVYVTETQVCGRKFRGMTNIGVKPTVQGNFPGVETYLFDCDLDLYGETASVSLLHFLRGERKFPSVEALREQLGKDEVSARAWFAGNPNGQAAAEEKK